MLKRHCPEAMQIDIALGTTSCVLVSYYLCYFLSSVILGLFSWLLLWHAPCSASGKVPVLGSGCLFACGLNLMSALVFLD